MDVIDAQEAERRRFCRRCLLRDMRDGQSLRALIEEVVDALPEAERAAENVYRRRLEACQACDNLVSGMCALCGCYVEVRAAKARMICPDIQAKW